MISEIANKFQNITKFDLYQYFVDYADFMRNKYPYIRAYFAGESESVNSSYMDMMKDLVERSNNLIKLFNTFGAKLGNVGYWELQNYCQDLRDTIQKVAKLPKYLRTSKTSRGYKPYVQTNFSVGGYRDFRDVSNIIKDNEITEESLILNNDLEEEDYEIDELKSAKAYILNNVGVAVKTILEQPIGEAVYGRDIDRKISFYKDDLRLKEYRDNVDQKITILLELIAGDIPEFPNLGRTRGIGDNFSNYNYTDLLREVQSTFLQDDLFLSVTIEDIKITNGDIYVTLDILTKYIYAVKRTIKI